MSTSTTTTSTTATAPFVLYFDAPFHDVDLDRFLDGVVAGLRGRGFMEAELAQMSITLHPGSIVVRIRAPPGISQRLQVTDTKGMEVLGYAAFPSRGALEEAQAATAAMATTRTRTSTAATLLIDVFEVNMPSDTSPHATAGAEMPIALGLGAALGLLISWGVMALICRRPAQVYTPAPPPAASCDAAEATGAAAGGDAGAVGWFRPFAMQPDGAGAGIGVGLGAGVGSAGFSPGAGGRAGAGRASVSSTSAQRGGGGPGSLRGLALCSDRSHVSVSSSGGAIQESAGGQVGPGDEKAMSARASEGGHSWGSKSTETAKSEPQRSPWSATSDSCRSGRQVTSVSVSPFSIADGTCAASDIAVRSPPSFGDVRAGGFWNFTPVGDSRLDDIARAHAGTRVGRSVGAGARTDAIARVARGSQKSGVGVGSSSGEAAGGIIAASLAPIDVVVLPETTNIPCAHGKSRPMGGARDFAGSIGNAPVAGGGLPANFIGVSTSSSKGPGAANGVSPASRVVVSSAGGGSTADRASQGRGVGRVRHVSGVADGARRQGSRSHAHSHEHDKEGRVADARSGAKAGTCDGAVTNAGPASAAAGLAGIAKAGVDICALDAVCAPAAEGVESGAAATTSAEAPAQGESSATQRLFNTLLVTFAAVFMGYVCARLRWIVQERGDMKGMGFFVGQIAFPLLIFNTVATAKLGSVDLGTLLACSLGKAVVMAVTWLLTFVAYKPSRSRAQRFLTATVFSFFAIASNDFAVGFPIVEALYGQELDMDIYIAGNALVGSVVFVPIVMVFFAIGKVMERSGSEVVADEHSPGTMQACLCTMVVMVRDILLNPVIIMTILGFVYKGFFGFTLVDHGMDHHLPSLLGELVTLVTSPFGMCALFLTGTNLNGFKISLWPILLVSMKIVLCAYASYFFAGFLIDRDKPPLHRLILENFTWLYGMIPSSSAPLIFAQQYDPDSAQVVATAIMAGLVLAGPMMFGSALFLEAASVDMASTITNVQYTMAIVSLACGGTFLALLAVTYSTWDFACPNRVLILAFGCTLVVYEALMLLMNPDLRPESCMAYNEDPTKAFLSILIGWVQNSSQFMVISMEVLCVLRVRAPGGVPQSSVLSFGLVALCLGLGIVLSIVTIPNTVTEMCSTVGTEQKYINVWPNAIWIYILLAGMVALGIRYTVLAGGHHKDQGDLWARAEPASPAANPEDPEEPLPCSSGEAAPSEPADAGESGPTGGDGLKHVSKGLIFGQVFRLCIRVVNTSQVIASQRIMGSFAQMLVVEGILEHGQLPILLGLMMVDASFPQEFQRAWSEFPRLWERQRRDHGDTSSEPSVPEPLPLDFTRTLTVVRF